MELLVMAAAMILPVNSSFYARPRGVTQVVDTVVARVPDHPGLPQSLVQRWQEESV
jgi:4-hydroxy-3-polyprenylbenzoate decarboxylase